MEGKLNSDQFLATFNKLEKHLKNELFRGQWKSFKQMLKEGSRFNPVLRNFKEELFEFADLRNAIVHNQNHEYTAIAEPHDNIVKQFAEITETVINPEKVNIFFKKVFTCQLTDPVSYVAQILHQNKISQLPVLDEKGFVREIFNANILAYWLAVHHFKGQDSTPVAELLPLKEFKENFQFISHDTSVYHATELFKKSFSMAPKGRYFDAILVNNSGQNGDSIRGIIVLSDIARFI